MSGETSDRLRRRTAETPDDAGAWYALGVSLLLLWGGPDDDAGLLEEASAALERARALDPAAAAPRAARAWILDALDDPDGALVEAEEALERAPDDDVLEVYRATLLSLAGREAEALDAVAAAARRGGVHLEGLRRELEAAGFPTDSATLLLNGFPPAHGRLLSRWHDELDAAARAAGIDPEDAERRRCREGLEALRREVDGERLPPRLRALVPWALRVGLGDDPCRARLVAALGAGERAALVRDVEALADEANAWLDAQDAASLPPAGAALLYLLEAAEEARLGG